MEGEKQENGSKNVTMQLHSLGVQAKEIAEILLEKKVGKTKIVDESTTLLISRSNAGSGSYGAIQSECNDGEEDLVNSNGKDFFQNATVVPLQPPPGQQDGDTIAPKLPLIHVEDTSNFLTIDVLYPAADRNSNTRDSSLPPISPRSSTPLNSSFFGHNATQQSPESFTLARNIKILIITVIFITFAGIITATSENETHFTQISTSKNHPYSFPLQFLSYFSPWYPILTLTLKGAFLPAEISNQTSDFLTVNIEMVLENKTRVVTSSKWILPILASGHLVIPEAKEEHIFNLEGLDWNEGIHYLTFSTTSEKNFPLSLSIHVLAGYVKNGALFGGFVIVGLYVLIIFELVNRTLSAMLAASVAIGILAIFDERPTTEEIVSWLDMETLILLFSMMVIVSIFSETGFFDYCAYLMYKVTSGRVWPMIISLCAFTAVVSAFLDNVTTVLLMTPVTIRICEAMELNPVPILIFTVLFSNIGGAVTPVGDPPNVIIANNADIVESGVDFAQFCLHMTPGILMVAIIAFLQIRLTFKSMKSLQYSEPYQVAELRREIEVWVRAADSLSSYSKDESHVKDLLLSKVARLKKQLEQKIRMGGQSFESYRATLNELATSSKIRDWTLLVKCAFVLSTVILLFFLHSVPALNLSMGWTALLGGVLLLILADRKELEGVFTRVEWSTLIFFSALFIVMEAVSRLGLLSWIGNQTEVMILYVEPESRLTVAIILILWVSGLASAFVDNIPFTTMMVQIVSRVAADLELPLSPLVWALAFGTCLGGNGTLIGASANVVCAGVAEQHGYKFTFMDFFKIGFPVTLVSLFVTTIYLLLCHSLFGWNG